MRRILLEKLLSAALTACLVIPFSGPTVVMIYVVLGHAHFLTAYYYKKLAGLVTRGFLLNYLFWATILVVGYQRWPSYHHITALATVYFLFHMVFDELYLCRLPMELRTSPMNLGRALEFLPIIAVYSSLVIDALFPWGPRTLGPTPLMPLALKVSYFGIILSVLLIASSRYRPDWRSAYFWACGLVLLVGANVDIFEGTPVSKFTGTIIIYHYLNWYFHYYLNLPTPDRRRLYVKRVLILNVVAIVPFLVLGAQGWGKYLYGEDYFYLWTMMHLITSTRSGDIVGLFKLPRRGSGR